MADVKSIHRSAPTTTKPTASEEPLNLTTATTARLEQRAANLGAQLRDASTGDADFRRAAALTVDLEDVQRELAHRAALAAGPNPELAAALHQRPTSELEAERQPLRGGWSAATPPAVRERQRLIAEELASRVTAPRASRLERALNVLSSGSPNLRTLSSDRENPEAYVSPAAMRQRTDGELLELRTALQASLKDATEGADREPDRAAWARTGLSNLDAEERLRADFARSEAPAFALHVHQLPTEGVRETIDMLTRLTMKTWNDAPVKAQLELARAELARR